MSLKGDLSSMGLSEIFQMISMSQREGTLLVQDSARRKSIYFSRTGVQVLSVGDRKSLRLGEILVHSGLITSSQLAQTLDQAKAEKKMLGESLVDAGLVTEEDIQGAVRGQIEEEIYDLFLWKNATFEFREGPPAEPLGDPDAPATGLSFDVNGLLLEAMRRADEWSILNQRIPSSDCIFRFVSQSARTQEDRTAPDSLRGIYRLLDGNRTVSELVMDTGLPRFDVYRGLAELMDRGRVHPLGVPELMALAASLLAPPTRERALRLFEAAATQAADEPSVLEGIAGTLESYEVTKEAALYHARVGRTLLERKVDLDRALEHLQRAFALAPQDSQSRLGTVEVLLALGRVVEAKETARAFVTQALLDSEPLRARALCDRVLAVAPDDLSFRILRAKALHSANQRKDLVEELNYIHQHMPDNPVEAEQIERALPETRVRIRPTVEAASPPRRRWSKLAAAAAGMGLLALGGAAFKYERDAHEELDRAIAEARPHLDGRSWEGARRRIQAFLEGGHRFALTPRGKAAAFLDELKERERAVDEERRAREERERLADVERLRREEAAIREDERAEPARALERARALRELAASKGNAELAGRAQAMAEALERHLEDARRLRVKMEAQLRNGEYPQAAETVDRLLNEFPSTESARDVHYPLAVTSRPKGVQVRLARTGQVVGVTSNAPLVVFMKPAEPVRLTFEKTGYVSPPPREITRKTAGTLHVELTERTPDWLWTAPRRLSGDPAVLEDLAFVAAGEALHALKLGTREEFAWSEPLDGMVEGSPRTANGRVFVATSAGWLYSIDPRASKAPRAAGRYGIGARPSGTPGVSPDGSAIYVASDDRLLHAVNARTLQGIWKQPLPAKARGEPVSAGGRVLAACENGALMAFDPLTGREAWNVQAQVPFGPLGAAGGTIYVSAPDQFLYAVDALKGRSLWPRRALPARVLGAPLRAGNLVFAAGLDGNVHVTDALTGEPAGSFSGGAPIRGGAASAGSLVLIGNDEGDLVAFDAASLRLAWKLRAAGPIRGSPIVAGRRAYFSCGDGLYAVGIDE